MRTRYQILSLFPWTVTKHLSRGVDKTAQWLSPGDCAGSVLCRTVLGESVAAFTSCASQGPGSNVWDYEAGQVNAEAGTHVNDGDSDTKFGLECWQTQNLLSWYLCGFCHGTPAKCRLHDGVLIDLRIFSSKQIVVACLKSILGERTCFHYPFIYARSHGKTTLMKTMLTYKE